MAENSIKLKIFVKKNLSLHFFLFKLLIQNFVMDMLFFSEYRNEIFSLSSVLLAILTTIIFHQVTLDHQNKISEQ